LRHRPDIRAAERELAAATARIGMATANLFPSVALTAGFGAQGTVGQSVGAPIHGPIRQWTREVNELLAKTRGGSRPGASRSTARRLLWGLTVCHDSRHCVDERLRIP
jgi:outer membrane protein TolC